MDTGSTTTSQAFKRSQAFRNLKRFKERGLSAANLDVVATFKQNKLPMNAVRDAVHWSGSMRGGTSTRVNAVRGVGTEMKIFGHRQALSPILRAKGSNCASGRINQR